MYSKFIGFFLIVCAFALTQAAEDNTNATELPPKDDCSSKFKQDDKHANISEECVKELKINPDEVPVAEEEFIKKFDDKCFGKCFMSKMGFLVDSKFERDVLKKDIEDHVLDAKLKEKILAYSSKCLDETEKAEGGKITKDNECAASARFLYCTRKEEEKLEC